MVATKIQHETIDCGNKSAAIYLHDALINRFSFVQAEYDHCYPEQVTIKYISNGGQGRYHGTPLTKAERRQIEAFLEGVRAGVVMSSLQGLSK